MYALVFDRTGGDELKNHFNSLFFDPKKPYLQLGGNETTGQGWFRVARVAPQ
jgi:CRISPR/Cas system CMR subunit Cmr4 (Cas7 group RAMP superfamily)